MGGEEGERAERSQRRLILGRNVSELMLRGVPLCAAEGNF